MTDSELAVEAKGLSKRYGDLVAVDGIDFEIRRGECFGFLGPNGAGKTTTMRMIYRASPVGGGVLRILGHDVSRGGAADRAVKGSLGVVPQEDNLDQELSVRENLEVFARFYGLARAEALRRVAELLRFVNLVEKADVPVVALSGGMKRRALVARGLIGDPQLVVLDEPTTGLDPQARRDLWERLRELRKRRATLVLTTHYMEEAEQLCDRLVIMDRGKIVARGAPRELIAAHVPPHVVEVRTDGDDMAPLDAARGERRVDAAAIVAEAGAARHEALTDRVLLYTAEAEALLARLASRFPGREALVRRATLEDVFLALTHRRLGGEGGGDGE
jgi:lipooligosaccharide transport system ATP-binding protein